MRLEARLDEQVGVATGEQAIAVAVAAVTGQACAPRDLEELLAVLLANEVRTGGRQNGVLELGAGARADATRAPVRRAPVCCRAARPHTLTSEGLVHQAEERGFVVEQTDERTPERAAGDERLGAVDRVDEPAQGAGAVA